MTTISPSVPAQAAIADYLQHGGYDRHLRKLRHALESQQHAMRVIGDWIQFYNHRRPHQALGMKTPAEAYALAA